MSWGRVLSTEAQNGIAPGPVGRMPACYEDRDILTRAASSGAVGALARWCALGFLLLAVPGCGLSSITSGLGGGIFGGSSNTQSGSVTEEQLLSDAKSEVGQGGSFGGVEHGCPRFTVWTRDNAVTIYEAGRTGDGLAVMHRGELTKTARECRIEPGRVTVKYGFSGRVLLGPKGRNGTVSLPVTVFVTDAKRERLKAETMKIEAAVSIDRPIGYFSAVRTVTFNIPEGTRPGEFELFVGFERAVPGSG